MEKIFYWPSFAGLRSNSGSKFNAAADNVGGGGASVFPSILLLLVAAVARFWVVRVIESILLLPGSVSVAVFGVGSSRLPLSITCPGKIFCCCCCWYWLIIAAVVVVVVAVVDEVGDGGTVLLLLVTNARVYL